MACSNWIDISATITKNSLVSVAYGNNRFLAVDYEGELFSSINGKIWTPWPALNPSRSAKHTRFVRGMFYLFCSDVLLTSKDGRSWVEIPLPNTVAYDLIYAEGVYVCVGSNQTVLTSSDLTNWNQTNVGLISGEMSHGLVGGVYGTVYGKNSCIIVGTSGTILQSSNNVAISMPWIPHLLLGE